MKLNRALAFLISMTMLIGVLPVSAMAADYAGDGITMDMEVGDPCANGHDYESVITREPTCKKTGIETFTCTVCGDSYDEEIPKTDHVYDDGTATEPTCTKAGKVTYTCTVCGHTQTEEGEPALGHSYTVEETKATCEKAGEIVYTCTRCGDKYKEEGEEALGHEYEKKVTKPATETSEGEVTYTCKRCKDSYKEAIPKLESKSGKKDDSKKEDSKKEDKEKDDSKKTDEKDDAKTSSCKVTLPSGKGYAIMAMGETTVDAGDSFSFTLNIAEGYKKGKDFSVKAGSKTLKEGSDGTYTIKNIKKDVKVKVSGVEKAGDMDEDLIIPDSKEEAGFAGTANGAAFTTDEPAVLADDDLLTDDPLNSVESEYALYVDGRAVTADNKGDILGEDDDEEGNVKKTAVYDDQKNTLTLDEATLSTERPGPAVRYDGTKDFTIIFKGNCFLVGQPDADVGDGVTAYGISAVNGSLLIKAGGEGQMTITNKDAITGKDVSFDENLCLGPLGVNVIPGGHGLEGDVLGVTIISSHQWSPAYYEWSDDHSTCTATKKCSNNVDHEGTEEGKVTSHHVEATATEPAKTVYTATFEDEVFEDQTAEVDEYDLYVDGIQVTSDNNIDILGKKDDEDGDVKKTAVYDAVENTLTLDEATLSSERPGPAVRYEGTRDLTIIFKGNCFLVGQADESVGDGVSGYGISAVNGTLNIKAGGTGELRITNPKAITGKDVRFDEGLCLGPEEVEVIPGGYGLEGPEMGVVIASSHQWSMTSYEWSEDYSSCTATKNCSNNGNHKGSEEGKVTSHYEEPTKDEPGKTVYTATFEDEVYEVPPMEVDDPEKPALGYDLYVWGDPVTAENQGDVLGDKTVTYDPVQNILKLNGATITAPGDGPAIRYNGTKTLTIEFTGNNSLTGTAKEGVGDGKTAYGIIADNGPLVIKAGGKGELRITNEEAISGMSISVDESLCIGPKGIFVIPGGTGYSGDSGMVISSSHDWSEWKKSETLNDTEERTCSKCGKTQTRDLQHEHTLEEIKEKPATCTEDGHIAYYQCSVCKLLFSDKEAKTEITTADLVPAEYKATGHDWNEPTYTWADDYSKVTATRVCKNNNEHVETETVATTKDVIKEATCEAAGDIIYTTAAFENTAFTQQTKEVKPAALGHLWGAPVFKWADSYTKATATFTCRRDSSHAKTVKAAVKGMITMPTTSTNGKITYTASVKVNGKSVTDTKEAVIKPAGTAGYKYTANAYSWNNTSSSGLNLTVKRSEYDAITFRAFTGVLIDGKTVSSSNYATAKGSLKLTLNKDYLKNLAVGAHTIKIQFKDGTAETKFSVRGTTSNNGSSSSSKSSSSSPKTGDDTNAGLWIGILIVAILGIAGILIYRKRKNK